MNAGGCERFGFVTDGVACPSNGCAALSCRCPESFPRSLASCTPDGCLVAVDCEAWCKEDFGAGFECTDTYTVDPSLAMMPGEKDAGPPPPPPTCDPAVVQIEPASIYALPSNAVAQGLLVDAAGNRFVAGSVPSSEAVDFGGGELAAGPTLFLVKQDASSGHIWSRRFGAAFGINRVDVLRFAKNGDILVAGATWRETDLGGGPEPAAEVSQLFVARYDADGTFVRSYLLQASNSIPTLSAIVELPDGEIDLWGYFQPELKTGDTTLTSKGEADLFLARFGETGDLISVKSYGDTRNDHVYDAVVDSSGNTYLLGFSYYKIDFGKDPIDLGTNSSSYVVSLDSNHVPRWQKLIVGGGAYPRRAMLYGDELVVVGDSYIPNYYYDSKETSPTLNGNLFALRIDTATGALNRADSYDTEGGNARVSALALGADGGPLIGGYVRTPADFGGGLTGEGVATDPFVARYDAAGAHLWSTPWCAVETASVSGLAFIGSVPVVQVQYASDLTLGATELSTGRSAVLSLPGED